MNGAGIRLKVKLASMGYASLLFASFTPEFLLVFEVQLTQRMMPNFGAIQAILTVHIRIAE